MTDEKIFLSNALEATIRIGLVVIIAAWCFQIIRPFIIPVVWGVIIAVAVYPGYRRFQSVLGERRGLTATLSTLLMLIVLIVPSVMLGGTVVDGAQGLGIAG